MVRVVRGGKSQEKARHNQKHVCEMRRGAQSADWSEVWLCFVSVESLAGFGQGDSLHGEGCKWLCVCGSLCVESLAGFSRGDLSGCVFSVCESCQSVLISSVLSAVSDSAWTYTSLLLMCWIVCDHRALEHFLNSQQKTKPCSSRAAVCFPVAAVVVQQCLHPIKAPASCRLHVPATLAIRTADRMEHRNVHPLHAPQGSIVVPHPVPWTWQDEVNVNS